MSTADASQRFEQLRAWVAARHGRDALSLELAAGDASFRRYYRLRLGGVAPRMLMDAPPPQEDTRPFTAIARDWREVGLPVPLLHAVDPDAGFIELEDLGDAPLHLALGPADEPATLAHFEQALALIDDLQWRADPSHLPPYDETTLARELDLFADWCLGAWLDMTPPAEWAALRRELIDTALDQRVVAVHRDYDAMNLMQHDARLYLIDFQDALAGPISYDLISLIHGRYCRFSAAQRATWIADFWRRARADGRLGSSPSLETFSQQVNAMAAQRALKVLGIFCRLTLRDERSGYLERLPHFLAHLHDALDGIPGHESFKAWLSTTLEPALMAKVSGTTTPAGEAS